LEIFNEIINETKVNTTIPPSVTSTNASDPPDIANTSNILNDYFVEVGPASASCIPPPAQVPHSSGSSVLHSFLVQFYQKTLFYKLIYSMLQNLMIHAIFPFRP